MVAATPTQPQRIQAKQEEMFEAMTYWCEGCVQADNTGSANLSFLVCGVDRCSEEMSWVNRSTLVAVTVRKNRPAGLLAGE